MEKESPNKNIYEDFINKDSNEILEDPFSTFNPPLDPRIDLPKDFPDIREDIQQLGDEPIFWRSSFYNLSVHFDNGYVEYIFDPLDFKYYPSYLTRFETNNGSKRIVRHIDFDLIKEIPENGIDWKNHYLISEDRILRINIFENNNGKRNI